MRYWIIILSIIGISGCTRPVSVKISKPVYPAMRRVVMSKDGSIGSVNTKNVIYNMLQMSKMIDELSVAPCYE